MTFIIKLIYSIVVNYKILFIKRSLKYSIYGIFKTNGIIKIKNENDLIKLVKSKKRIRVFGEGWSWNKTIYGEYTIKLEDEFNKFKIDNNKLIVGSGMMIVDVLPKLIKRKKQLKSIGACITTNISQTFGGVIATNVNHTGKDFLPFSENCLEIKVLHWDKNYDLIIKKYKVGDDYFKYFFGTIGTFGIILEATFELEALNEYRTKMMIEENDGKLLIENLDKNPMMTSFPFDKNWLYQFIYKDDKINEKKKKNYTKNVCGVNSLNIFFLRLMIVLYHSFVHKKIRDLNLIRNIYSNLLLKNRIRIDHFKNIWELGDSKLLGFPTLTMGLFVNIIHFDEIMSIFKKENLLKKYYICLRYIPKLKNSIFNFGEDDILDIDIAKTNIKNKKNYDEMNSLFNLFIKKFSEKDIRYFVHPGKYFPDTYKIKQSLEKNEYLKYETLRKRLDPFNQFVVNYND